jgi:hypothetical protein
MTVDQFISKFDDFDAWSQSKQVDYLAFYLLSIQSNPAATVNSLSAMADQLGLKPYKRLPQYLSESVNKKEGHYIKAEGGYRLEFSAIREIAKIANHEPVKVAVSAQLTDLAAKITDPHESQFLKEALDCYRIDATRAAITLVWNLSIYHLQKYTFMNKLGDFNVALAKNSDKKLISSIKSMEDFSELKESKFIELLRSANIISKDVRKILDEKLGTRNSAAHPSSITLSTNKATEFALDLLSNVLIKY